MEVIDFLKNVSPAFVILAIATSLLIYAVIKQPEIVDDFELEVDKVETLYKKIIYKHNNPYFFNIKNCSNESKKAVLYGHNMNLMKPNFGSDNGVCIEAFDGVGYSFMLTNSVSKEFIIRKIRVQTAKSTKEYLENMVIKYTAIDPNGQMIEIPIIVKSFIKDNQLQKDIVDIELPIAIDGNASLSFPVDPNSYISMYFYYNTEKYVPICTEEYDEITERFNNML